MRKLLYLFLFVFFLLKGNAQSIETNTIQKDTTYREIIPEMEFDSTRISRNGRYAIVFESDYTNDCFINSWKLYERGLNNPIENNVFILEGFVYFITYEKKDSISFLSYEQNEKKYTWSISKKYKIKDFIKKYDLKIKPINRSKDLKVVFSILPSTKMKIPYEHDSETKGDSLLKTIHRIELQFQYEDKNLHKTQIEFLSCERDDDFSFNEYCQEIQRELKQTNYYKLLGVQFFESNNLFFLRIFLSSEVCTERLWFYTKDENTKYFMDGVMSRVGSSPGATFQLLSKF